MTDRQRRVTGFVIVTLLLASVELVPRLRGVVSPLSWVAKPVEGTIYQATTAFRQWILLTAAGDDGRRIGELENVVALDGVDQARLATLEEENAKLKELVALKEHGSFQFVSSRVVGQDPRSPAGLVRIGAGSRDGVTRGAAVVTTSGLLVGVVVDVGDDVSSVRLLRSRGVSLLGKVAGREELFGIVESLDGLTLRLTQVAKEPSLAVGDVVVTNFGLQGVPADLPLGRVVQVIGGAEDLWQEAIITPLAPLTTLKFVNVIVLP